MRLALLIAAGCASLAWSGWLQAQEVPGCGTLRNAYGPFDFRSSTNKRENLPIVEQFHFTPEVESLRRGASGTVLGDLRYTLRAFPNHHRALAAIARYAVEGGRFPADDMIPTAECYFDRAIAFVPDDGAVHAIYGSYLQKTGEKTRAREEYETALRLSPESVEINYLAGLYFVDVGDLARAKQLAQVAYDGGYPLPGLKNKIEAAESPKQAKKK